MRKVAEKEIIETDDGLLKAYSKEIRSRTTVNYQVQSGIKVPNTPLKIVLDAEYTASMLSSKFVIGRKTKTRTIASKLDFPDIPQSRVKKVEEAREEIIKANKLESLTSLT